MNKPPQGGFAFGDLFVRVRFRYHRLHPARDEIARPPTKRSIAFLVAALVLAIIALIAIPVLRALLPFAELLVLLFIVIVAVVAGSRLRRRVHSAEAALQAAAVNDEFWSAEQVLARVESLFKPYWRAVQQRNVAAIAAELSPRWRERLERAFAIWLERGFKPVLFTLALNKVEMLEVDDQPDPTKDRFVALVDCTTSYHVTDTRTGEVVEGIPDSRVEKQAWHFVRSEQKWLLDRVERLGQSSGEFGDFSFDFPDGGTA